MSVDKKTTLPVDIIKIKITTNGSETFYFYPDKEIDIRNIDVKALKKGIVKEDGIGVEKWVEADNYLFSVDNILKTKNNDNGYGYSARVILLDSPPIPASENKKPTLRLKFYIYYVLNGDEKRIVVDSSEGKEIVYYSEKYYRNRVEYPYTIQVDSIYRPFFFNAILLFRDENYLYTPNTEDINTHAIFTYSIANGCTLRHDNYPLYYIGDIKLNISNTDDENTLYEYKVKNHFRVYSEIESFENGTNQREKQLKKAHENGIKERGSDDGIMYLPKLGDCKELIVNQHYYNEGDNLLIPSKIEYYCGENKIEVHSQEVTKPSENAYIFDTKKPLNISFNVNDASPDNINYKTCSINYSNLVFPSKIERNNKLTICISRDEFDSNVKYKRLENETIGDLTNEIIKKNNVCSENDLLNYINGGRPIEFVEKDDKYEAKTSEGGWILAIYGEWYDDNKNYIKHTNKLTVMRLYKI